MDYEPWERGRPESIPAHTAPSSLSSLPVTMSALAMASASCTVLVKAPVAGQRCSAARASASSSTNIATAIPAHHRAIAAGVAPQQQQQQQPRRGAPQVGAYIRSR